jgi:hypothetical protein
MTEQPSQYFCGKCGRVVLFKDKRKYNWLISDDGFVVRCPQHITDWQMRKAKKKRTMASYKWRRIAKEQDIPPKSLLHEPWFDI